MQVKQVMNKGVRVISEESKLKDALERMKKHNTGILLVKDDRRVGGILSSKDVLMKNGNGRLNDLKVRDVMNSDVRFVYEDQPVQLIRIIMDTKRLDHLVVLNRENRITGICTRKNLDSGF